MKHLTKRLKKIGAPPGSLIYTGDIKEKTSITLFLYDSDTINEYHPNTTQEALTLIKQGQKAWLHISGISDAQIVHAVGKYFKLHPLMLEDIMNPSQRSKLDDYKDAIYIATNAFYVKEDKLTQEQISLVIGNDILITFSEVPSDLFMPIITRLMRPGGRMRQRGSDYLAYTILDAIVDNYFLVLEREDQKLEILEGDLLKGGSASIMFQIQEQKRDLMLLRKTIWPMREVINQLRRIDSSLISETTRLYVYDVYDHTIQAIETVEGFRDLTAGMHDIHVAIINQKMNETIRYLTVVSTIFVPLTFITSLYGMNFVNMPELHSQWGYPLVLLAMLAISLFSLIYFRRKHWL
jgi:magnesium transporter